MFESQYIVISNKTIIFFNEHIHKFENNFRYTESFT